MALAIPLCFAIKRWHILTEVCFSAVPSILCTCLCLLTRAHTDCACKLRLLASIPDATIYRPNCSNCWASSSHTVLAFFGFPTMDFSEPFRLTCRPGRCACIRQAPLCPFPAHQDERDHEADGLPRVLATCQQVSAQTREKFSPSNTLHPQATEAKWFRCSSPSPLLAFVSLLSPCFRFFAVSLLSFLRCWPSSHHALF